MGKTVLFLYCFVLVGTTWIDGRELRKIPGVCSKGQSYWCQNITTAVECSAIKHCIQGVWELEKPIEVDKSEICQTCLDMVKQARDQLLSNQTQEEIKEVLEGTCKLIPVKIVSEECMKLMDQFAPELVDMLASQMDPQIVCSVAGLCDNSRVHRLEAEYKREKSGGKLDCNNCGTTVNTIKSNLNSMEPHEFLHILTKMCSNVGSYSDGCNEVAIKEHRHMLNWLREKISPVPVCSLAGVCRVQSRHSVLLSYEGLVSVRRMNDPDLPCELCMQLVQHLRDILVSNTTEEDFKLVLTGICNQLSTYKDECLSLVNSYYNELYQFLTTELDGKIICGEIKLCPTQDFKPLFSVDSSSFVEPFHLPVTRYNPITYVPSSLVKTESNGQTICSMCEFFLHFVQQEITLPSSEEKIKEVVEKGCARLPSSVSDQCKTFVDTYMDEFIALLAQEIDPSQVCPMLGVCPRGLVAVSFQDKPTCPLCLLAFQEINMKLKNKTRASSNVNDVVDDLCIRDEFPESLSMTCVGFVMQHRSSIIDMVLTEFTPQESCAYINICVPSELSLDRDSQTLVGDINTNEIRGEPDGNDPNACVICEFIMTKVAAMLKDKKTEEEIKDAVFHVCDYMPRTVSPKCRDFITQYADLVIELLAQEVNPKEVCTYLNLCSSAQALMKGSMRRCLLCEVLMDSLRVVLTDPSVDDNINQQLRIACRRLPIDRLHEACWFMVNELAPQIEMALRTLPVGPLVCRRVLGACDDMIQGTVVPSHENCLKGSSYWCISSAHAAMCNAIDYCQKEVWKGNKPRKGHNKGHIIISN